MLDDKLLRFKKNQLFFVSDFETENLNLLDKNRPWEFAGLLANQKEILEETHFFIKWPDLKVSKDAARITGYYDKVHLIERDGISPLEASNRIDEYLRRDDVITCGHNFWGFDTYIERYLRNFVGKKTDYKYMERLIDSSLLSKAYKIQANIPEYPSDEFSFFQDQMYNSPIKGVKHSVGVMCKEFDIEYDEAFAHSAPYDVNRQWEITKKLLWLIEI